jgi:hypothetical protein
MELTIKVYASIHISGKKGSAEPGVWILQKKFVQIQEEEGWYEKGFINIKLKYLQLFQLQLYY